MCKNNIITILSVSNISPLNLHHRISNMQRKLSLIACALQKHPVFLALVQYTDKRTRDIKTGRSHRPDSPTIVDKSPWDALSVFFNWSLKRVLLALTSHPIQCWKSGETESTSFQHCKGVRDEVRQVKLYSHLACTQKCKLSQDFCPWL